MNEIVVSNLLYHTFIYQYFEEGYKIYIGYQFSKDNDKWSFNCMSDIWESFRNLSRDLYDLDPPDLSSSIFIKDGIYPKTIKLKNNSTLFLLCLKLSFQEANECVLAFYKATQIPLRITPFAKLRATFRTDEAIEFIRSKIMEEILKQD